MKKQTFRNLKRIGAGVAAAALVLNLIPFTALAVSGDTVAKDGTYSGSATVEEYDYDVNVDVTVLNGKISGIEVTNQEAIDEDEDNAEYFSRAMDGTSKKKGAVALLTGAAASESGIEEAMSDADAVSKATYSLKAIKKAAINALATADPAAAETEPSTEETTAAPETEPSTEETTEAPETEPSIEETTAAPETEPSTEETTAAPETQPATEETQTEDAFVLMNIPYGQFYAAEGDADVDAMSSATKSKPLTGTLAGGSYHNNSDGSDISGVTYPVKVSADEMKSLVEKGYKVVTDADSLTITSTNRGQTSTTTYTGKDALFGAGDYAYYVLSETPAYYKDLDIAADGSMTFGKAFGEVAPIANVEAGLTSDTSYGDYQLNITSELPFTFGTDTVYAVTVNTTDGDSYGMKHVENMWRGTQLAWSTGHTTNVHGCTLTYDNTKDMEGKTIESLTYYTSKGIYELQLAETAYVIPYYTGEITASFNSANEVEITGLPENAENATATVYYQEGRTMNNIAADVEVVDGKVALTTSAADGITYTVKVSTDNYAVMTATATYTAPRTYVLMNIPYGQFYAAEGDADVDAMSSATKSKPLTGTLAGGSYHNNSDGSDISGVIYPVEVIGDDIETLKAAGYKVVTDEDSLEITTTNRGQTSTATYTGKDALFGAGDYAYYVLTDVPSCYKTVTFTEDGSLSFGKAVGEVTTVEAVEATLTSDTSYGDYQLNITSNLPFTFGTDTVYAVTVNTTDGDSYGMKHVENMWRGTQLAWSTGHTTNVHGCTLSYDNTKDMEGKTIESLTYYTSAGIFKLQLATSAYVTPYYTGEITASFNNANEVEITGLPEGAENATATVYFQEGRTMTAIAEDVEVVDGKVATETAADGTTYTVKVSTDNYAVMTATATYGTPETEETPSETEETPSETETVAPSESETVAPSESETVAPSETAASSEEQTTASEKETTKAAAETTGTDIGNGTSAKTGDSNAIGVSLVLILLSGAACMTLLAYRRRQQ